MNVPYSMFGNRFWAFLSLIVVAAILCFVQLGHRGLWASHEARAAQHARVMLDDGDWLLPRLEDGTVDLQKPPGYYWMVALTGKLTGTIDAATVRFPAALAGFLTVLAVAGYLGGIGRPTAGVIAGFVLLTGIRFTGLARVARIDMPLTLAITGGLLCFAMSWRRPNRASGWQVAGWACFAAAVLLKGPIGLVLPIAVLSGFVVRSRPPLLGTGLGFLVFMTIALPWFVLANQTTGGELFDRFFWYHNVERALGGSGSLAEHPWWYYLPRLAIDAMPWTPSALFLTVWLSRYGDWRRDADLRLGFVWLATMTVLLSCAQFKRGDYLAPVLPGLALFVGCACEQWLAERTPSGRRLFGVGFAMVILAVMGGWLVYENRIVPELDARQDARPFARVVQTHISRDEPLWLFQVENHALTFHLNRPVHTVLEWDEFRNYLTQPGRPPAIVPTGLLSECEHLLAPRGVEILADDRDLLDRPARPLVLIRATEP